MTSLRCAVAGEGFFAAFCLIFSFQGAEDSRNGAEPLFLPRLAWVYCEILPIKQHRFSLEVALSDDIHSLYLEFLSLDYQKNTFSQH
jgi:hypothetical protein